MDRRQAADLDRYITGNYVEDQFKGFTKPKKKVVIKTTHQKAVDAVAKALK